jgi:hypothetical protein
VFSRPVKLSIDDMFDQGEQRLPIGGSMQYKTRCRRAIQRGKALLILIDTWRDSQSENE